MRALRRFVIRLAAAVGIRRDDERLREELETHLALQTAGNRRAGLPPDEARRQALLKFGAVEATKERYREEQRLPFIEDVLQDVQDPLRQLRRAPIFTFTATLSLAAGIGANAAVFTLIDRLLLRSLPVADPAALVFVTDQGRGDANRSRFSYPFYARLGENGVLKGLAAQYAMSVTASADQQVARVRAELVSGNYFTVVGTDAQLGRTLSAADDRTPGAHPVAVISDRFWRRRFGSEPSALGRVLRLNHHSFTIVGVAKKEFIGTDVGSPTDLWLPLVMQRELGRDLIADAQTNWLEIFGRLESGMAGARAGAALTQFLERSPAPSAPGAPNEHRIVLAPGAKGNSPVRRELGQPLRVLQALTALALVLACVNVASLLGVRSAARQKEIAVRLALGARRSRLAQQFITEGLVLAALGGTAGMIIAPWAAGLLAASQPDRFAIDPGLDLRVFLFGLVISVTTGLAVGQAPIIASTTAGIARRRSASRIPPGLSRRLGLPDLIVTCQIALSLAMLICAALLVQSLRGLSAVDPGFQADGLLLVSADPAAAGYNRPRLEDFWRNALDRVSQIPGVQSVSLARKAPLAPSRQRQPLFNPTSAAFVEIDTNVVGSRYFPTLGIPVVQGREFGAEDGRSSRPVVIVNERLARMLWPDQDPIGKGVRFARDRQELEHKGPLAPPVDPLPEVVGVVRDAKYRDLRGDAEPMVYRPFSQTGSTDQMTMHVRAAGDASALAGTIRREMATVDANVPLFDPGTLSAQLDASFSSTRQAAALTGAFGVLALLLSGIGVYGVTAQAVSRRTREIGIRIALGAQPRDIIGPIGRRGLTLVMLGLGLGLAASFGFTRVAGALLFGVAPNDPATYVAMSGLLLAVALAAVYAPAMTATRLDPVSAIRCD